MMINYCSTNISIKDEMYKFVYLFLKHLEGLNSEVGLEYVSMRNWT